MFQVRPDILDISKALGEETRFSVFCEIASSEVPLTVKDLVAIFGMHHSAIRIHLNRLEEAGLIISQKRHTKGAVGRPQLAFLPNPHVLDISLPPRNYQFMADLALDYVTREGLDLEQAEEFASVWGRAFVVERRGNGKLSFDEGLSTVCEEMRNLGGTAEWAIENGDGTYVVREHNCPFAELSSEHDELICSLHQSVAQGMLSQTVNDDFTWEHVTSMRAGDHHCLTRISPEPSDLITDGPED
jgi:predicted ArsR family transcriptional regulator